MADKKLIEQLKRIGRQGKQGATLGFSDEIQDLIGAGIASAATDMTYSEALKLARELSKKQLAKDWEEAPVTSFLSQAAGGIPLGMGRAGKAATNWIRSGSAAQGIGRGAALGAGLGGIAGAGSADDTVSARALGAALGAGSGAIIGGATAPLSRMGGGADKVDFRKVAKQTSKPFTNKAQKQLAEQLAARPDLPEMLSRAEGMGEAAKRAGIQLTLPEMIAQSPSDPLLTQQAVIGSNPMTAGRMAQLYAARSGTPQQTGQIEQSLLNVARGLAPDVGSYDEAAASLIGGAQEAQRGITRRLSQEALPLYEAAYQKSIPQDANILQNPLIQSALQKVKSNPIYAQDIQGAPDNSILVLDAVKRSLDDMSSVATRQGAGNEVRLINSAKSQLLDVMDNVSPEYAQARQVYSGNPEALQMRQGIGGLADIDPLNAKSVNRALYGGTQQNAELAAQALGEKAPTAVAARIYGAMDEARGDPVTLAKKIAPDQRTTDMLKAYGGQALEDPLSVIQQAQLGERTRYGAPTQPRQQAESMLSDAANAAIDVKTGGVTAIMRKVAGMLGKSENDPQFYSDMADLMLTDQGLDLLRRVASGQQGAIQELQSVGLPSLVTGYAASSARAMPFTTAGIGGAVTPPQDSVVYTQPKSQELPQGFSLRQELPAGFIIRK